MELDQNEGDLVTWSCGINGEYSVKSAYEAKFWGRLVVPTAEFTWQSKAPLHYNAGSLHGLPYKIDVGRPTA